MPPAQEWSMMCNAVILIRSRIQEKYEAGKVGDRLQNLTVGMLKANKKSPKLRAGAAHCRALAPICQALANEHLNPALPVEQAVISGLDNLQTCYRNLGSDSIFYADALRTSSIRFAQQYVALEAAHAGTAESICQYKQTKHIHCFLFLEYGNCCFGDFVFSLAFETPAKGESQKLNQTIRKSKPQKIRKSRLKELKNSKTQN